MDKCMEKIVVHANACFLYTSERNDRGPASDPSNPQVPPLFPFVKCPMYNEIEHS